MEHDELKIREKIISWENLPMTWNKEHVWQQIGMPNRDRRPVFLYAAASIALLMVVVILSQQYLESKRLDVKLAELTLAIEKVKGQQPNVAPQLLASSKEVSCEQPSISTTRKRKSKPKLKIDESALTAAAEEKEPDAIPADTPEMVEKTVTESSVPEVIATREPVKVIMSRTLPTSSTTEKKFRFSLFLQDPETLSATPARATNGLVATINH